MKRIVRYLIKTRDKGICFTPNLDEGLDCYVDADYAGMFGHEDEQDPVSVILSSHSLDAPLSGPLSVGVNPILNVNRYRLTKPAVDRFRVQPAGCKQGPTGITLYVQTTPLKDY